VLVSLIKATLAIAVRDRPALNAPLRLHHNFLLNGQGCYSGEHCGVSGAVAATSSA